jgi:DNA-binding transcriptional ArsR family regulator
MHSASKRPTDLSEVYGQASAMFRALSHPVRLHILDELRKQEACVCHLQVALNRPQAYVSQQLRVLREAGLVEDERDGMLVYYRLADAEVKRLLDDVLGPAGEPERLSACSCPHCNR